MDQTHVALHTNDGGPLARLFSSNLVLVTSSSRCDRLMSCMYSRHVSHRKIIRLLAEQNKVYLGLFQDTEIDGKILIG